EVVVVGPEVATPDSSVPVRFAREDPPGGGPLAGLAAGVAVLDPGIERVVVLAVDMPHVSAGTVARLLTALDDDTDAAWLTGADGRRQLAGALRPGLVPGAAEARGAPMHRLMSAGAVRDVRAVGAEADDIDTLEDLARLRP